MVSGAQGYDSVRGIETSLDQLSKASPCLKDKTAFELTKKWSVHGIRNLNRTGEDSSSEEKRNELSFMDQNIAIAQTYDGQDVADIAPTMFDIRSMEDSQCMASPDLRKKPIDNQTSEVQAVPDSCMRQRATEQLLSLKVGQEENQIDIGTSTQSVSFYYNVSSSSTQALEPAEPHVIKPETLKQKVMISRNIQAVQKPLSRSMVDVKRK